MFTSCPNDEEVRAKECGQALSCDLHGVALSPEERKLIARFDERRSRRSAGRKGFFRKLPTTVFIHY